MKTVTAIGSLSINKKVKENVFVAEPGEPIFGGYENRRGEILLFGEELVYRINSKSGTVQQRPPLNAGAQAKYEAAEAGEAFEYCNVKFRRLSNDEIVKICASGPFRATPKQL